MSSCSKLKFTLINMLRDSSADFIDFVLHLSQLQDKYGRCRGIYYRDVCQELGISPQTFYNFRDQGEKLKIFNVEWEILTTKDEDWSFRFIDNEFNLENRKNKSKKSENQRYLNTNIDFLYTNKFRNLKRNAKIMVLYLLGLEQIKDGKGKKLTYETLMGYAGVNHLYILRDLLESIKVFFDIQLLEDGAIIRLQLQHRGDPSQTATMIHALHLIKAFCRRLKAEYKYDQLVKTAELYCKFSRKWADEMMQELRRSLGKYRYLDNKYIEGRLIDRMAIIKAAKLTYD